MKSLTYHHIAVGGVPMTLAGAKRFMVSASQDGYTREQIEKYLFNAGFQLEE